MSEKMAKAFYKQFNSSESAIVEIYEEVVIVKSNC